MSLCKEREVEEDSKLVRLAPESNVEGPTLLDCTTYNYIVGGNIN